MTTHCYSTILTIDDDCSVRENIVTYLEDSGYIILQAENGRTGLEMFRRETPDLILVDLCMPEVDGLEVLAKVTEESPETPIIVVSGAGIVRDAIEALRLGAWDYVLKPIHDMDVLEHVVRKALERARLLAENEKYYEYLQEQNARIQEEIIERKYAEAALQQTNAALQQRTRELSQTLDHLKATQQELIQSAKMAALGQLVAGIAHELNTPVGVSVMAASFLETKTREMAETYSTGTLQRSGLETYIQLAVESASIILSNLTRASKLIQSFKQVATDESLSEKRDFNLKNYIDDVLLSLSPMYNKTKHLISVNCPEDLSLTSYPGAFMQILTNLIENSLLHGFENIEQGNIALEVQKQNGNIVFRYSDNGKGMEQEHTQKIFDPFFTTKRSQRKVGLGMHIVYNLVAQGLGGHIECQSDVGRGTTFMIQIPLL